MGNAVAAVYCCLPDLTLKRQVTTSGQSGGSIVTALPELPGAEGEQSLQRLKGTRV